MNPKRAMGKSSSSPCKPGGVIRVDTLRSTMVAGGGDSGAFASAVAAVELVLLTLPEACAGVDLGHPVEMDASTEVHALILYEREGRREKREGKKVKTR